MTLTEPERVIVGRYIRWVADAMELRDWTMELSHGPADEDAYASIRATYGRKVALVKLCDNFRTLAADKQRHNLVHELVHCHLESAANMVLCDIEEFLGKQSDQIFYNGFKRQIEYGVDALASAIAKHMPLIDWEDARP